MTLIPSSPSDIFSCGLFKCLKDKSTPEDGAVERAMTFIDASSAIVDLIVAGPFKEYTLHNKDHSKKLMHLCDYLLPKECIRALSTLELLTIIYSCFLHDMGMSITSTERERILNSDEFLDTVREWPEISNALKASRIRLDKATEKERFIIESEIYQIQEAALCAHLRPRHATSDRYKSLITFLKKETHRADLFEFRGVSFEPQLIDICVSHNLDVGVLAEVHGPYEERYPRDLVLGGERLNTQFCAALLRLIDILDFDRERTPKVLFESLGISSRSIPGADVSLKEWQKHMSVHSIEIGSDEIIVSGESHTPVIEKAIKDFCAIIEREIRDTLAVLRRNPEHIVSKYFVELPISVRSKIRANGYVYKDFSLRLNESAVMSLLMGERLYANSSASIRELIQNSIDACSVRERIDGIQKYSAQIAVTIDNDDYGHNWIQVKDNGIGMDEYVLGEYFFKIGSSYYDSPEFQRLMRQTQLSNTNFVPISRFGIGIISVFMIADILEVDTRNTYSPRGDTMSRHVRVERMGGLAFVKESPSGENGTTIRLRIKQEYTNKLSELIRLIVSYLINVIVRPKYDINIDLLNYHTVLRRNTSFRVKADAKQLLSKQGIELIVLDISRWSNKISGIVVMFLARKDDNSLSHILNEKQIQIGYKGIEPFHYLDDYCGNRITVNGFKMSQNHLNKVLGSGKEKIPIAYDIDVQGDDSIIYDVSRNDIIGKGKVEVRNAFRDALLKGIEETGILCRLVEETRNLIDINLTPEKHTEKKPEKFNIPYKPVTNKGILELVKNEIPDHKWPVGLHRIIAEKLQIANSVSFRAIQTLLRTDEIKRPADEIAELTTDIDMVQPNQATEPEGGIEGQAPNI